MANKKPKINIAIKNSYSLYSSILENEKQTQEADIYLEDKKKSRADIILNTSYLLNKINLDDILLWIECSIRIANSFKFNIFLVLRHLGVNL